MIATLGKAVLLILVVLIPIVAYVFYHTNKISRTLNIGVEVSDIEVEDAIGKHTLKGQVWIGSNEKGEVVESPKGIILVSHGFSSHSRALQRYSAALARSGFVVAALNHNDIKGLKSELVENDPLLARSRHLSLLLDTVQKSKVVGSAADLPVGFVGFSLGGFAALSATGQRVDFAAQRALCPANVDGKAWEIDNVLLCNPRVSQRINRMIDANLTQTRIGSVYRSIGTVLLAPAYLELVDIDNSENAVAEKIFLVSGSNDELIDEQIVSKLATTHQQIVKHKKLPEAGHYVYLEKCPSFLGFMSEICKDPVKIDRTPIQETLTQDIIEFFESNTTAL